MMGRLISALRGTCQLVSVTSLAVSRHRWTVGVTWCRHVYIRHLATTSGIDTPTPSKVAKHKEPVIRNSNKRSNDLVTNPVATAHPVTRTRRTGEYKGHKQQFRKFEGNDNYNRKPYQHNRFEDGKFGQNNVRKPYQDNRFEDGKFGQNNVRKPYQDNRFEDGKFDQNYVRKPYQHNRFEDGKFGQNNVRKPYQDNRFEDGKFGQNNVRKPYQDNRFEDGKFAQNNVRKPYQDNRFEDGKFAENNVRKPYQDNRFEDGKFDQNNVRKPYQHNRFEDGKFDQNDVRKPYQHNRFEDGKFDQNNVRNFYNTNGERLNTFSNGQFNGVKGGDRHREEPRVLSDDNSTVRQRSSVYSRAGSDVHRSPVVRRIPATDSRPEEATDLRYTWEQLPDEDKFGTGGRKTSSVTTTRPSTATGPPHGQAPISGHPAKWSDVFGTQTRNGYRSAESRVDDEPNDEPPHIPLSATNRRHVPDWYGRRIQKLGKRGQVKESLAMLEDQMMKQDRVKPRPFEFRAAIGTLANVGFTSKAFKLFKQMGRMDIRADHHTYTSLFNACAHSPYKDYGLREAEWLYNRMKEKEYKPQYITYQAMIKAFGMCGDLETAFHIADQCSQQYRVTVNLLSSLLVACLSNRDTGLRHAIMVWRKMTSNRILPETRDYNLLLRAVNTCGVGDQQLFSKMLMDSSAGLTNNYQSMAQPPDQKYLSATVKRHQRPLDVAPRIFSNKAVPARKESRVFMQTDTHRSNTTAVSPSRTPHCEGDHVDNHRNNKNRAAPLMQKSGTVQDNWWQTDHKTSRPGVVVRFKPSAEQTHSSESTVDIMNLAAPMSKIISVSNIKTASDKLCLLGGANKLMAQMARDGAKPDIVTFIMLMLAVPAEEEADILDMMSTYKVDPETSLFNHLIHKRAASQRPLEALAARKMMDDYGLKPNMKTFGCLAMICKKPDRGFTLVKEMQDMDLEPNLVIMTTLVYQSTLDFQYKAKLLQTMDRFNLPTTEKMIFHIENHISLAKEILLKQEKGEELDGMHAVMAKKLTAEKLESFVTFYDEWIKTKSMEEKEHPWKHFIKKKPRENTDKKD